MSSDRQIVCAGIAQLVEHLTCNQAVVGSTPIPSTIFLCLEVLRIELNSSLSLDQSGDEGRKIDTGMSILRSSMKLEIYTI